MPRGIFVLTPPAGVLPFMAVAQLRRGDGTVVQEGVPVSVWPADRRTSDTRGSHTTHTGEAPLAYADDLDAANRRLVIPTGAMKGSYVVTEAVAHTFLPHVALRLTRRGQ